MSRAKGDFAEERAVVYLQERAYIIVDRNYSSRFGEIDIIAQKDGVLHFVEVKSADEFELAIQNITSKKLSRIIKTAQMYMSKNCYDGAFTFDAIIVTPLEISMVEDITI